MVLDFIVSFIGDRGTRAKFHGVYRVVEERPQRPEDIPANAPFADRRDQDNRFFYKLERQTQYDEFRDRVIIEWGGSTTGWHQYLTEESNKSVIEILPKGRVLQAFSDYLDFTLTYQELKELISNPEGHRDWQSSLTAVAGVYLILAETTGQQYVGSAYGLAGFWARWQQYATNGHGDNKSLQQIIRSNPAYPKSFRYSILQVLPKSTTKREVLDWERLYKMKLGSRATGLNLN